MPEKIPDAFSAETEAHVSERVTNVDRRHGLGDHAPPQSQSHTAGHAGHDQAGVAEVLDLDAEVLVEYTASIVAELPVSVAPQRIADLGCGTGAGTFALLARFPEAHVTAVDASADHLTRLRQKACEAGVVDRIHTVVADLDTELPPLGEPDLIWTSASLHHLLDPEGTLRRAHSSLRPGGILVVVEVDGFPRFLPEDAPRDRPGLEARCHEVSDNMHRAQMPYRGADFGPMLIAAGFAVETHRTFTATVDQARSPAIGRYAFIGLSRMRDVLSDALPAEDLAALDHLLDPENPQNLLHRDDLTMRTQRTVWIARRVD